jgi:Zn-dependent peptidase ImmA (M78 family)/predicted secreted protein
MARISTERAARLEGSRVAAEEHERLGSSMRERIEIFDIIEDARIWLLFKPLRELYGAYERYQGAAGIIINAQHPMSLQRFTAAHEYGHHLLGHRASADDEEQINGGRNQVLQEVAAQAFAGAFLMPIQLVNYTLRTMGVTGQRPNLSPRQIYQLALELGVSYSAAITVLVGQKKISPEAGRRLRHLSPLAIKTGLVGEKPEDSWADVWLLDEAQEGREFIARLRDEVHVTLPEIPSSGYVWQVVDPAPSVLALVEDRFEPQGDADQFGSDGLRHLWFRVTAPGTGRIRLEKRRPWLTESQPTAAFEATLAAIAPITGDADDGLTDEQKQGVIDDFRTVAA